MPARRPDLRCVIGWIVVAVKEGGQEGVHCVQEAPERFRERHVARVRKEGELRANCAKSSSAAVTASASRSLRNDERGVERARHTRTRPGCACAVDHSSLRRGRRLRLL
jgi:hypothetical protein